MTVSPEAFDALVHHRNRTRHAEARADALEQINDRLFRLLGLALLVACKDRETDPLTLLAAIEDTDAA